MSLVPVVAWLAAESLAPRPTDPSAIVGGTEAATCEWPNVVAMLEADETPVMCSGSLIHTDVVLTAAHCIIPERPIVGIGFGEAGQVFGTPAFTVAPESCVQHPDYATIGYPDLAYCRLSESVTEVPIVPLLASCETDALQPGAEVTIVGFGATWGTYHEETDSIEAMGVGAKRYTTQTIDYIDEIAGEVYMFGPNGSQSACFGDSGGPSLVELSDGTWRVFGAGSHLHDPGGLPPPMQEGNICGTGVAYGYASIAIDWLESATGVDLVPCWDGDAFVDGPGCGATPMDPGTANGSWDSGCAGGALGGEQVCEAMGGETGDETGGTTDASATAATEDTGDDATTGDSADTTGIATVDPSGATADATTDGGSASGGSVTDDGTGASAPTSGTDETGDGGASEDADDGGCGCTTTPRAAEWAWWSVLVVLGRARPRRRAASLPG